MSDVNNKLRALRDEAWQAVIKTKEYQEFQILDSVVKQFPQTVVFAPGASLTITGKAARATKRVTQVDVAAHVLHQAGEPLTVNEWLKRCLRQGIGVKGEDPLPNFRSTVSRSDRFYNFTHEGTYYWWLKGVALPDKWKKATERDLLSQPVAFNPEGQKGGEADAYLT
ncbi:MAG: hypothetical protein ACK519_05075 [Sphingomonadaceae bacterium]